MINQILAELILLLICIIIKLLAFIFMSKLQQQSAQTNKIRKTLQAKNFVLSLSCNIQQTSINNCLQKKSKHIFSSQSIEKSQNDELNPQVKYKQPKKSKSQLIINHGKAKKLNFSPISPFSNSNQKNLKHIKLSREGEIIMKLSPSLTKMKQKYVNAQHKPQIRYLNTILKVKRAAERSGCQVKISKQGASINLKNKEDNKQQLSIIFKKQNIKTKKYTKDYDIQHLVNRYLRKNLLKRSKTCSENYSYINLSLQKQQKRIKNIKNEQNSLQRYRDCSIDRMKIYLKKVANKQTKIPYRIKKKHEKLLINDDETIVKNKKIEDNEAQEITSLSEMNSGSNEDLTEQLSKKQFSRNDSKNTQKLTNSKQMSMKHLEDDINEFRQICSFLQKIQHEMLRYQPNNHLQNRINKLIDQSEHSDIIRSIYKKINENINFFTVKKIIKIIKKYEGLLSNLNYFVNMIKLNISAQRRKRFKDRQSDINKIKGLVLKGAKIVGKKLSRIDNEQMREDIMGSINQNKDLSSLGLKQSYISFVAQAENRNYSERVIEAVKHVTPRCEILKYEALMK